MISPKLLGLLDASERAKTFSKVQSRKWIWPPVMLLLSARLTAFPEDNVYFYLLAEQNTYLVRGGWITSRKRLMCRCWGQINPFESFAGRIKYMCHVYKVPIDQTQNIYLGSRSFLASPRIYFWSITSLRCMSENGKANQKSRTYHASKTKSRIGAIWITICPDVTNGMFGKYIFALFLFCLSYVGHPILGKYIWFLQDTLRRPPT